MMKLKRLALKFATGVAAAVFVMEGASIIQGLIASKRKHVALFSAAQGTELLLRQSRRVVTGRVLASGTEFGNTIDIVRSGDWLLALRLNNRLTGLNLRSGIVRDFSAFLANQKLGGDYHVMWRGRHQSEVLLGNIAGTFTQLSVTSEGIENGSRSFARPKDLRYSLPLAEEKWASNGFFRDDTTLVVDQLLGDRLTGGRTITKPVFPGISPFVSLEANRNSIVASPDGQRLAQGFWFAPFVYIFDSTGTLLRTIPAPVTVSQAFSEHLVRGDVRMQYLPETTRCYIALASANKRVIGLFSGNTMREAGSKVEGKQLHVMDWDGQLIEIVNIDSSVSRLAASPDGDLLWAVRREPDPAILEYGIPRPPQ